MAIEAFDAELKTLVARMFEVMYAAEGCGLAAPQIGVNRRLMVFNPTGDPSGWRDEVVLCNPRIVERSERQEVDEEACLSFPDMSGDVPRAIWVKVEAEGLDGRPVKKKYVGFEARLFQHEYDHLDGVVYIDRLVPGERGRLQPSLDELIASFGDGGAI